MAKTNIEYIRKNKVIICYGNRVGPTFLLMYQEIKMHCLYREEPSRNRN